MRVAYAVTFEFDTLPPLTHRGIVEATHPGTCTRLAVKEAQAALKPARWSSLVVVLLERLQPTAVVNVGPES